MIINIFFYKLNHMFYYSFYLCFMIIIYDIYIRYLYTIIIFTEFNNKNNIKL